MLKTIMIAGGTISLALGILGIFIPGLPTTPFILLTAALYIRSSPRLYAKIQNHRLTAKYLNKVRTGISLKIRMLSIGIMWVMILLTIFYVIDSTLWRIILVIVGVIGTIVKLKFPEKKSQKINKNSKWKTT